MDWRVAFGESFVSVRDQLRRERALGQPPRRARVGGVGIDMKDFSDASIDAYARREAERRTQESINRHKEEVRRRASA